LGQQILGARKQTGNVVAIAAIVVVVEPNGAANRRGKMARHNGAVKEPFW
jgi:hypothetical protein